MEIRLSAEDGKQNTREQIAVIVKEHIDPVKARVSKMEHWQTALKAGLASILFWIKYGTHAK